MELSMKYVRSCGTTGLFMWLVKEDTDVIEKSVVKKILAEPTCDQTEHLRFSETVEYDIVYLVL